MALASVRDAHKNGPERQMRGCVWRSGLTCAQSTEAEPIAGRIGYHLSSCLGNRTSGVPEPAKTVETEIPPGDRFGAASIARSTASPPFRSSDGRNFERLRAAFWPTAPGMWRVEHSEPIAPACLEPAAIPYSQLGVQSPPA